MHTFLTRWSLISRTSRRKHILLLQSSLCCSRNSSSFFLVLSWNIRFGITDFVFKFCLLLNSRHLLRLLRRTSQLNIRSLDFIFFWVNQGILKILIRLCYLQFKGILFLRKCHLLLINLSIRLVLNWVNGWDERRLIHRLSV